MIRLFRKVRNQLLSDEKYSMYILYASGEIALVMVGILLALQIDSVLADYGADAINPYLAFETIQHLLTEMDDAELDFAEAQKRYIKAVGKGLFKVMSKMGISTYQSYCGAQIFDAVGLASVFVDKYFAGTTTTIEGVGLTEVADEAVEMTAYEDFVVERVKSGETIIGLYPATKEENLEIFKAWRKKNGR